MQEGLLLFYGGQNAKGAALDSIVAFNPFGEYFWPYSKKTKTKLAVRRVLPKVYQNGHLTIIHSGEAQQQNLIAEIEINNRRQIKTLAWNFVPMGAQSFDDTFILTHDGDIQSLFNVCIQGDLAKIDSLSDDGS